ncbi:MAG: hypothetical protein HXS45_03880 [Theionarchaea archaeon]|nr:hypothetical protein [Theionarchaea archaeon]
MKGIKILIFFALMVSLGIPVHGFANDTFSVDYTFNPTMGGCGKFLVENSQLQSFPGEPLIPYRAARILLPQDTTVKDIRVKTSTPVLQTGIAVAWGQPPCTFSDIPVRVGRNEDIYNSDSLYPKEVFQVIGIDYCRGFAILNVHLFPVQYKPQSGTVIFYSEMTVEVQFEKGAKNELYTGLPADKEDVTGLIDNPDMAQTYGPMPVPLQNEEYIIITNDAMKPTFQMLADFKAPFVNGSAVYTVSWIAANYSGADNQMKMRNFIIDKYTDNGTKYVLLGGDIAAVPYRGFYVSTGGYTDSGMLADMYFSHLDGTHNADGDSYYGEPADDVDWYAEVAVGRAPCETVAEAQDFVNKIIAYEQTDKPKRVLLHQSRVQTGNTPDSRCLAFSCDDYIPNDYTIDYLFEEDGTVTKAAWISHWAQNPLAVAHIGHGSTNVYYINYEIGGTVSWYNSDIASMTNTFWPWTTSVACITGQIEANDCLAEAYVKDPGNGAIAAIYNDNYGWFSILDACMYSGEFCINEFRASWSDGKERFGDMLNQARSYLASSAQGNSTYRWCFYERNLVGDPETPFLTKKPPPDDSVTITNPANGATVSETVTVTTSTTGCIDTVEFYIDGLLKSTDTTPPFQYNWDTTQYSDGTYTIEVKGYCSGVYKDNDIVTVTLHPPLLYYVTINNPVDDQIISGTVICTADSNCDSVKWYIDGTYFGEDTSAPFKYNWDTTLCSDGTHTLEIEGYVSGVCKSSDSVTVNVFNNPDYVTITHPQNGETVSGHVLITVDTSGIDEVRFFIDETLTYTDTTPPFEYLWKPKKSGEGSHVIRAEGYHNGAFMDDDQITVNVIKKASIALLSFMALLLPFGIVVKRH